MVTPRLWLIFFSDGSAAPTWWSWMLPKGFRHVSAASFYADQRRWVHFAPTRGGTVIEVFRSKEFDGRLAQLTRDSSAVLRVPGLDGRRHAPASFFCVGAVKGLLGVRCLAISPRGLFRWLLRNGAERVEIPHVRTDGRGSAAATPAAGGPPDR
jgi:hypothetical protein